MFSPLILIGILLGGFSSLPDDGPAPSANAPQERPEAVPGPVPGEEARAPELHWAVKLGMRSLQVEQAFPLIDRVVLVPDAATYVEELSRWSPAGRWPVLFEDDELAPMFIRRFKPAEVIRRHREHGDGVLDAGDAARRKDAIERVAVRAWGGGEDESLAQVFAKHGYTPPGVVIASIDDPAWTAAAALAAGRGQPLAWLERRTGSPNAQIEQAEADALNGAIEALLDEQGFAWRTLGEGIDAITICRALPGRVNLPRWDTGALESAAITDYLGRDDFGRRYAVVGWIFGDEARSAYVAMCSLFLPRERVWLYHTYPISREWEAYAIHGAAAVFAERGCEVHDFAGPHATEAAWLGMLPGGIDADVFVMNTKGNADFFDLSTGSATPLDVPLLSTPAAVHLTHSWSMRAPENADTVGGAWLANGAYAYVGSVQEPYLSAFVPPLELARRWMGFGSFLAGARHLEAPLPFGGPWKVNTFGDPLMMFPPPIHVKRERVRIPAAGGENLQETVRQLMRTMQDDASGAAFGEAVALLALLGRDEIAVQVWRLAEQTSESAGESAARAALGPLFRARDVDGFLRAWVLVGDVSGGGGGGGGGGERARDMLWHLMTPRVRGVRDEDVLLVLQASIRRSMPHVDLARLAPALARAFGPAHVRSVIERELGRAPDERARRRLRDMLAEY